MSEYVGSAGLASKKRAGSEGHVGSNGDVSVTGSADVFGDLTLGPTGALVELNKPVSLSGEILRLEEARTLPPVSYALPIAASGDLVLDGEASESLSGGVYRFSSFDMDGHSTLDIDGAVVLYIDGAFTLKTQAALNISPGSQLTIHHGSGEFTIGGGGIVNPEAVPAACQVFSATTDMVSFSGGADFYGNRSTPRTLSSRGVWFSNLRRDRRPGGADQRQRGHSRRRVLERQ